MNVKGVVAILVHQANLHDPGSEQIRIVGLPVSKVKRVEPSGNKIWSTETKGLVQGSVKSVIRTTGDDGDLYVTETVEEVVKAINTPLLGK